MKLLSHLSPFLMGIFTVISLYAANSERLEWTQMIVPLILVLVLSAVISILFMLNKWTAKSWAFIASMSILCLMLWYSITPLYSIIIVVISLIISMLIPMHKITQPLSIFLIFAILVSGGQAVYNSSGDVPVNNPVIAAPAATAKPNIYFIVPDRMPSIDAMRESNINPDKFVSDMKSLGFYVKENQMSSDPFKVTDEEIKTTRTMRYFASVLNGGIDVPLDMTYKDCRLLIKQGSVFNDIHLQGYTIHNVASWFAETKDLPLADYVYKYNNISLLERVFNDELTNAYWSRTIFYGLNFRAWESEASIGSVERGRALWQYGKVLELAASGNKSQFVMCHLLMPHEPFVFDKVGGSTDTSLSIPEQYYSQIEYALSYLSSLAKGILESDPSAIIIIQSDEGMAYKKPIELNFGLSKTQWNGVLTAWKIEDNIDLSSIKHTDILKALVRR